MSILCAVDIFRIFSSATVFVVVFQALKATCCCHTLFMANTKLIFTFDQRIFVVNFMSIVPAALAYVIARLAALLLLYFQMRKILGALLALPATGSSRCDRDLLS